MLGPGRYLLGAAELALLAGSAWLGGAALRKWLLPRFRGTPAALATTVISLALLIWSAELLGSFGLFEPVPYLLLVAGVGVGLWRSSPMAEGGGRERDGSPSPDTQHRAIGEMCLGKGSRPSLPAAVAVLIVAAAVLKFALEAKSKLSTGMTGFDSTWYHGPFAAGFFQSGNTMDLHFIAPQFLAWFYPANGEIFHAVGMLAFGRDVLSPLLNLGWFVGCLLACWCVGRPYRVAPWSLALGAVALSVPALADQAGEARNDLVGIFFLLAAVAIALNAWAGEGGEPPAAARRALPLGALAVAGLSAGLAAGTKLNFLLPAAVLVAGLAVVAPRGGRWRALCVTGLSALAGGGYWYLRNLAHAGNPLPWVHHLGPISLPAPEQALGGREAHSVLGYLGDGKVWSEWLLPGLHHGLWIVWPLLVAAALAGLILPLTPRRPSPRCSFAPHDAAKEQSGGVEPMLALAGLVGLATAVAWLVAPTSASGPEGMPRGFESGLRYLAPALVLGLALLPTAPLFRSWIAARSSFATQSDTKDERAARYGIHRWVLTMSLALVAVAIVAIGYPVQRHYLRNRYANPSFTTPGLNAAFAWASDISHARIATTSTRQYPLFGADLTNHVQFVGEETPHGGFEPPTTCRTWRRELNAGHYDYVIATRDRLEPTKPPYPPQARWTEGPGAKVILRKPPTVVFQLEDRLDSSACK